MLFNEDVCGYIRLTKKGEDPKRINEISIAIIRKLQNSGIGSYAYKLFEKKIKKRSISKIVAKVVPNNIKAQNFFLRNGFKQISKTSYEKESSQTDYFLFEKKI